MLSDLRFEVAAPADRVAPNRADVACFVGTVPRRSGMAVAEAVRANLRASGWVDGPWDIDPERVEDLRQVPVAVDGWEMFDRLFAWERRELRAGKDLRCATYLGSAVRSFFAHGGRRAVVIRTGDPWPYLAEEDRAERRPERLAELCPGSAAASRPFDPTDPGTWLGTEHLYGLPEVSHVCLPDLADICSNEAQVTSVENRPPSPPEVFVECSVTEPADPDDHDLRLVSAPRLDVDGYDAWRRTVDKVRQFLKRHRHDVVLVAALPLPGNDARISEPDGTHAQADWLGFLQTMVLPYRAPGEPDGGTEADQSTAASAFVQLVWPWLRTIRSEDLPERLEPGDGLLAGVLANNALARGTFRSVAGTALPGVIAPEPMPDLGLGPESLTALLAERVCLIGPEPDGIALLSDVTSAPDRAWRQGGVSRLMATLLRAARRVGEAHVFDANGPELWRRIRGSLEDLLDGFLRAGALSAAGREEAYTVRCDRSTMTQNDLDNGRLRAEITVLPAGAIERITVSLELYAAGAEARLPEVA